MVNKIFFGLSVLIFSFSGINLTKASLGCNCWKTRDSSFQTVPFSIGSSGIPASPPDYRNDDGSSPAINLPFNFCFYGKSVNTVYINNNGNISIGAPNGVFDSRPFPDSINAMIAPFWADIDTRGLMSGIVYYSLSPTHLIVQWDHVSYYNLSASPDSLFNTFQLIITNGLDPIIPIGENVSFCYQDMQWTTGEQSGGLHGFPFLPNAFPATVGVNQGTNSMSFIQLGTFDKPGTSYDGGFGLSDGIDWLDNQSFNINACVASSNIPPILNSLNLCDTIRLCENTTQLLTANYISPEPSETTTINFSAGGIPGLSILSNTPGNSATLVIEISGMASNLGFHTLSVTATDDGLPSATTISNFVIEILPAPIPGFSFLPASPVKANNTVVFTNTAPSGSLLTWDFGDGSPLTTVPNPQHVYINTGSFSVSLSSLSPNGCFSSVTQQIVVSQCISATFSIDSACIGKPVVITYSGSAPPSAVFNWSFSGGDIISGSGIGPYIISWDSAGAYSVSLNVMDSICSSTTNVLLNVYPSPEVSLVILNQTPLCEGQPVSINSVVNAGGGASFNWIFGSATVISGSGYGPYSVQWNIGNAINHSQR